MNRRLKSDTRRLFLFHRPNDKFVCSAMRKGGEIVPRVAACVPRARGGRGEGERGKRQRPKSGGTPLLTQARGQPSSANVTNLVKAFWSK